MKVSEVLNTLLILAESKVDLVLGMNKDIQVLRNPNNADLENVLGKSDTNSARMSIDIKTRNVWIWNGDFNSHYDVQKHLEELYQINIEFDARFIIVKIEYKDEDDWGYAIGGDSYSDVSSKGTVDAAFDRWKNHRLFVRMFGNKEFGPVEEVESTYWNRFKEM